MRAYSILLMSALLVTITNAQEVPVLGEGPSPFDDIGPDHKDIEPVRVRIVPDPLDAPLPMNTTIEILTDGMPLDFPAARALPGGYGDGTRRPNIGHLHVYGTLLDDEGIFHETNVFLGAAAFQGTPTGAEVALATINFPAPGEWLLVATAQYDDHTLRLMNHPQQWPSLDAVVVTVVPEPGAIALTALAATLAAAHGRGAARPRLA